MSRRRSVPLSRQQSALVAPDAERGRSHPFCRSPEFWRAAAPDLAPERPDPRVFVQLLDGVDSSAWQEASAERRAWEAARIIRLAQLGVLDADEVDELHACAAGRADSCPRDVAREALTNLEAPA